MHACGGCVCAYGVMYVYMHHLVGQKFLDVLVHVALPVLERALVDCLCCCCGNN